MEVVQNHHLSQDHQDGRITGSYIYFLLIQIRSVVIDVATKQSNGLT